MRLCLRKTDQWLPLRDLKYAKELGDEGVQDAMRELCSVGRRKPEPVSVVTVKVEEREVIDLTADFDDSTMASTSSVTLDAEVKFEVEVEVKPVIPDVEPEPDYGFFADDESKAELRDLLECLTRDELAKLVKDMKLRPEKQKVRSNDN